MNLATRGQLTNENLGLGSAWVYISVLEEEEDIKPFYSAVHSFYVVTLQKMLKKFPFGDSILKDLGTQICHETTPHFAIVLSKGVVTMGHLSKLSCVGGEPYQQ